MGQTTTEIEAEIQGTRYRLGSNLEELERKVRTAADWKEHFRNRPAPLLGLAFGGGALLAMMIGGRMPRAASRPRNGAYLSGQALETWDRVKGALIGVAATRFTEFVSTVIPGFHEEYHQGKSDRR